MSKKKWICGNCGKEFELDDVQMLIPVGETEYEACKICFEQWQANNKHKEDYNKRMDTMSVLKNVLKL